jgi:hypothetical protein
MLQEDRGGGPVTSQRPRRAAPRYCFRHVKAYEARRARNQAEMPKAP